MSEKAQVIPVITTPSNLSLDDIQRRREELEISEQVAIKKAFESNNVQDILKAQATIQKRTQTDSKSLLLDPLQLASSFGYKDKPHSLSFNLLRAMSKTHVIKAIVETRKEQIAAFCSPQKDKYSTGFVIQRRSRYTINKEEKKLSKKEEERIEDITEFILNCGNSENQWHGDSFDVFVGKIMGDSLVLDQATFECVRNRSKQLIEFFATDGATYRLSDSYDGERRIDARDRPQIYGYVPSHVQIYQNRVHAEFYPWELGFGVRNPQTDILLNGYGRSELEDMVQTVTAILNSDFYNANFFKVGSSPKGILKYSGNINQNTVEDFRRQWVAQVAGVANMHKIPMINADKLDFINTMVNNKDMEFAKYQEFLIKISCALYKIDPSEIGFPMSGSSDAKPMFEGNNEARLKYSKDKGLKPLLKRLESWINKWIVYQLDPSFEFRFVGIDSEGGETEEIDLDIKKLSNFMTFNEIRAKHNLEDVEGGDVIGNPTYLQAKMQAQQGNQGANDMMNGMFGDGGESEDDDNPFTGSSNSKSEEEEDPFMKALQSELPRIFVQN